MCIRDRDNITVRTRINEERILNRIDSDRLLLTSSRFDFVEKYHAAFGSIRKTRIFVDIWCDRKKSSISQNTPPTSTEEGRRERRRASLRAHRQRPLFFFWRRRLSSYHSQLLLSGRRKPLNATHGTTTTLQQFKFLSFSSVLGRSRASRRALPIELVGKNCLRPPGFLLRSHRRSTLCYDLYLWARLLPRLPPVEGHDLWPRLGSSVVPKHRCVASGVGTCLSSCITTLLEVNSIRSNQKTVSWASFFIWIGPTCRLFPSTQFTNVSLVIYTLPFIWNLQVDKKWKTIWLDSIWRVLFVYTGPNSSQKWIQKKIQPPSWVQIVTFCIQ